MKDSEANVNINLLLGPEIYWPLFKRSTKQNTTVTSIIMNILKRELEKQNDK